MTEKNYLGSIDDRRSLENDDRRVISKVLTTGKAMRMSVLLPKAGAALPSLRSTTFGKVGR